MPADVLFGGRISPLRIRLQPIPLAVEALVKALTLGVFTLTTEKSWGKTKWVQNFPKLLL